MNNSKEIVKMIQSNDCKDWLIQDIITQLTAEECQTIIKCISLRIK